VGQVIFNRPDSAPISRVAALHYRDFRLYWIGLFLSNIGTWMQTTALNWLIYEITRSPLQLGMNGLFRAVPAIGLGIISGTIADRFDRKKLMLTTQSVLGTLALLLGVLDHSENIQLWQIYAVTFLSAAVASCDGPARQALFPTLVPESVLPNAVALNAILMKGPALVGPLLAGTVISLIGTHGAFYANAASYSCTVVALLLMRTPTPAPAIATKNRFSAEIKSGLNYVYSNKIILGIIAMEATSSVFGMDNAMLTIFASDILRVGAHGFGMLQSARGIGAIVGSSLFISVGQRPFQGKILLGSSIVYGICFALFGLSSSFVLSLALLACVGAADAIWAAARSTILQWTAPNTLRGRVMGIFQIATQGLNPVGQVETGVVVPLIGAREATFFGGSIVWLITMVTIWRIPQIRKFSLEDRNE
jgi:MFS family permease